MPKNTTHRTVNRTRSEWLYICMCVYVYVCVCGYVENDNDICVCQEQWLMRAWGQ